MRKKTILSSVICCVALNGINENLAMEYNPIRNENYIERKNEIEPMNKRRIIKNTVLKSGKSDIAKEISKIQRNEKVEVLEQESDWAKIRVNDKIGYVELIDLETKNVESFIKYLECLSYLTVYQDSSCQKESEIGKIYNNQKVSILEIRDSYIKIRFNGEEAFIKNKNEYLVDKKKRTLVEGTKIYTTQNEDAFKQVKEDVVVVIEEEVEDFYRISYNGKTGYVKKENALDMKNVKGTISFPIKLYVEQSDKSDIRAYIPPGSKVQIIETGNEYVKIMYGEYEGYVLYGDLSVEGMSLKSYADILNQEDEVYLVNKLVNRATLEAKYEEILEKYKSDEESQRRQVNKWLDEMNIVKGKFSEIKIMSNKGKYLEVELNGETYYMDNQGKKVDKNILDTRYIEAYPTIATKVNTRYISESDTTVYLDKSKEISLGILAEDTQVEFIEDVENEMSKIKVNESFLYIEKERLSETKMYVKTREEVKKHNTGKSHQDYVKSISTHLNMYVGADGIRKATEEEVAYYSNPINRNEKDENYKYQYLKLDEFRMVDANVINKYLNSLEGKDGKRIFKDKADIFIQSAQKYNIDPIYLIAHTMLETGYGTSNLAMGQVYEPQNVTVYNFFGIGAIDSNPLEGGKRTAYENGWTSIDKTIEGSAKWLATNYIHSDINGQNTLYKMRYNYMTKTHQYASDIMWASKISTIMKKLSDSYIDTLLTFEVPRYQKGTYMTGVDSSGSQIKVEGVEDSLKEESSTKNERAEGENNISIEKPIEKPNDLPMSKPIEMPVEKPIEKPIERPIERPIEKPSVGENDKPVETPDISENDKPVEIPEVGENDNLDKA